MRPPRNVLDPFPAPRQSFQAGQWVLDLRTDTVVQIAEAHPEFGSYRLADGRWVLGHHLEEPLEASRKRDLDRSRRRRAVRERAKRIRRQRSFSSVAATGAALCLIPAMWLTVQEVTSPELLSGPTPIAAVHADAGWAPYVSNARIAELDPYRRRLAQALDVLGPSIQERLDQVRLTIAEESAARRAIAAFADAGDAPSPTLARHQAREQLVAEHGARAVPYLVDALRGPDYWSARVAAQALGQLARGPEAELVKWLAHRLEAPAALIGLFGRGPWSEQGALALELDATLQGLSSERRAGPAAWRSWWSETYPRWLQAQRERERLRNTLDHELTWLLRGVEPNRDVMAGLGALRSQD